MQTLNNQNGIENSSSQQDCEFTYAGFLPRLFAYIIDIIVIGIASFFIKNIVLGGLGSVSLFSTPIIFKYTFADIFSYLLKVLYFIICLYCTQTTLGKYIFKLKVVRKDGTKLSLFNVIYRETIGRFLSSFLCVGYILIFIDKEKTALHDRLCDSRVIYACNVKKTVLITRQYAPPAMPQNHTAVPNGGNVQNAAGFSNNASMPNGGNVQNAAGFTNNASMPNGGNVQNAASFSNNDVMPYGNNMQNADNSDGISKMSEMNAQGSMHNNTEI